MTVIFRPLGKVREFVQSTGMDIAYAYDDLVFSDHSMFIIRFDEKDETLLHLYFNNDCNATDANIMETRLKTTAKIGGFELVRAGKFTVDQIEGKEELEVKFLS